LATGGIATAAKAAVTVIPPEKLAQAMRSSSSWSFRFDE
jgi:hypothetical protein